MPALDQEPISFQNVCAKKSAGYGKKKEQIADSNIKSY